VGRKPELDGQAATLSWPDVKNGSVCSGDGGHDRQAEPKPVFVVNAVLSKALERFQQAIDVCWGNNFTGVHHWS
jgi:hypothetical protein